MSFEEISYVKLWWPFCLAEQNHLCSFGLGHYEEYFELGPVVQEMSFKDILSRAMASILFCVAKAFVYLW